MLAGTDNPENSENPAVQLDLLQTVEPSPTDDPIARARRSIEQHLLALPQALQDEQVAIRRRYEHPQHRTFPVAVSVLIPKPNMEH